MHVCTIIVLLLLLISMYNSRKDASLDKTLDMTYPMEITIKCQSSRIDDNLMEASRMEKIRRNGSNLAE